MRAKQPARPLAGSNLFIFISEMNVDKNIIKSKIEELIQTGSAAIFEIGEHYVQVAVNSPGEMICEAVSHHYHSAIDISLESSFAAMGFHLEEGGNYSRIYSVTTDDEINRLSEDIEKIFRDMYRADENAPFAVTDVE